MNIPKVNLSAPTGKKIIKIATATLLACIVIVCILSNLKCSLKGKWTNNVVTLTLDNDDSFSIGLSVLSFNGTYDVEGSTLILTYDGLLGSVTTNLTYSIKKDILTLSGLSELYSALPNTVELQNTDGVPVSSGAIIIIAVVIILAGTYFIWKTWKAAPKVSSAENEKTYAEMNASVNKAAESVKKAVDSVKKAVDSSSADSVNGAAYPRTSTVYAHRKSSNSPVATRGKIFLEDGEFELAVDKLDKALDMDPTNGELYLYLAMAETGISELKEVRHNMEQLEQNRNYQRFLRYATEEQHDLIYERGFCPKCGVSVTSEMGFCSSCGAQLHWDE